MIMWLMNLDFAGGQAVVFPVTPPGEQFLVPVGKFHFLVSPFGEGFQVSIKRFRFLVSPITHAVKVLPRVVRMVVRSGEDK